MSALIQAAEDGDLDEVQRLVEQGANVEEREDGSTALLAAVGSNHGDVVDYLLVSGANPNASGPSYSPLTLAIANHDSSREVMMLLVRAGAAVNDREPDFGWTALMVAAANDDAPLVKLLLEKGADISIEDAEGETAISFAADSGASETLLLLLDPVATTGVDGEEYRHSASRSASDLAHLRRCLMGAARRGRMEALAAIWAADPSLCGDREAVREAWRLASENDHQELARRLEARIPMLITDSDRAGIAALFAAREARRASAAATSPIRGETLDFEEKLSVAGCALLLLGALILGAMLLWVRTC